MNSCMHYFGRGAATKYTAIGVPGAVHELNLSARCLECGTSLGGAFEKELQPATQLQRKIAYVYTTAREYQVADWVMDAMDAANLVMDAVDSKGETHGQA